MFVKTQIMPNIFSTVFHLALRENWEIGVIMFVYNGVNNLLKEFDTILYNSESHVLSIQC